MIDISVFRDASPVTDIFVGCVGYEDRSTYLVRTLFNQPDVCRVLFDYRAVGADGKGLCSYESNLVVVSRLKPILVSDFLVFLHQLEVEILARGDVNVVLDVTSFDRAKLGELLLKIFFLGKRVRQVRLIYCPREFVPFDVIKFDVVQSFGPVLPEFFGSADGFEKPLSLILGAGYEYGKAVGAIDTLEPDHIYCFRPTGTDPRFDEHIDKANVNFGFMSDSGNIISYDLNDAVSLYSDIRKLVEYEMVENSVLILPLGPKMFAALCLLVATILHPSVMVWRHSTVSASVPGTISDAFTTGKLVEFAFEFA
jgi:hypothetical protein